MNNIVRLKEITIQNFKNVNMGQINFINKRKDYRASILGLYGQNGSGKTALIDAIQLLKYALCGNQIPSYMADYINVDEEYAKLKYVFNIKSSDEEYEAFYEFNIKKEESFKYQNIAVNNTNKISKLVIFDEVLSYSFQSNLENKRKETLINTNTEKIFVPDLKYECLIGKNSAKNMELIVAKNIIMNSSRSFIFSIELLNTIRQRLDSNQNNTEFIRHLKLLESLVNYGNFELFIINTSNTGIISMNALPLTFKYEKHDSGAVGQTMISLENPTVIPKETVDIIKNVISNMNIVLKQIVPGLTISLKELGNQILENGEVGELIQLMSNKNSKDIPLKYESEGIKKIISILQLLIVIYNKQSITVAIDEIDSGIFEYLLGEILRIISEKGKGQLIFTSHNLRPLETIDKGFIAFTTTNPYKRYIRLTNIKDNNNLRDFYFRDIVLGEQNEPIYETTNNYEISLAFREAWGDMIGS